MNLTEILENQLKNAPSFITEHGELKKWVVIHKAQLGDATLVTLLLEIPVLKETFFTSVKDALIFNSSLFIQFLEHKNYLGNSYTRYRNKIGLTINDQFVKQQNSVALVWPYKDGVLEGAQQREDRKTKEVFFNRTLDQEEITQLLEPKVLTAAAVYNAQGKHDFKSFRRDTLLNKQRGLPDNTITDNLIIKGNNLLSLHTIKTEFTNKVKLIYIDPPYNTGSDSFNYNDSFNHATWLTFMKNRLEVAKTLLKSDGAIFVQCDDNEQAYLKILMDEVYGRENYRETIVVKSSTPSGVNAVNVKRGERLFKVKEYLLFYSKNPDYKFKPLYIKSGFNKNYRYEVLKTKSGFKVTDLKQRFKTSAELEAYALKNPENIFSLEKNNKKAGEKVKAVIQRSKEQTTIIEHLNTKNETIYIYKGGVFIPLADRIVRDGAANYFGTLISDLWDDEVFQTNQTEGGVSLPGGKKPEKLLNRILELTTNEQDIVLDYHLGSGTTAAVAHKMNRQYIGLEQLDYGKNDSVQRLVNVINGDTTGISKKVNWVDGGSFIYFELKKYNLLFVEQIQEAKNTTDLLAIWETMKQKSFIEYKLDIHKKEGALPDFKKLKLQEQKQVLLDALDMNQLYVNKSSLHDATLACTNAEIDVTTRFYKL